MGYNYADISAKVRSTVYRFQNYAARTIVNAPSYLRDNNIHRVLRVEMLAGYTIKHFFDT